MNEVFADSTIEISTCNASLNNTECSSNPYCRCSTLAATSQSICTLHMECESSPPCGTNYSCSKPGTVCVRDWRCNLESLCYPESIIGSYDCPIWKRLLCWTESIIRSTFLHSPFPMNLTFSCSPFIYTILCHCSELSSKRWF